MSDVREIERSHRTGEWGDEFFEDIQLEVDGEDVVISESPIQAVERGEAEQVAVIWEGALDFEGPASEAKQRYPDLAEYFPDQDVETVPQAPEEGDYTTEDYRHFYQYGKLAVTTTPETFEQDLRAHMEQENFYPDVWVISDHGNAHLITLGE